MRSTKILRLIAVRSVGTIGDFIRVFYFYCGFFLRYRSILVSSRWFVRVEKHHKAISIDRLPFIVMVPSCHERQVAYLSKQEGRQWLMILDQASVWLDIDGCSIKINRGSFSVITTSRLQASSSLFPSFFYHRSVATTLSLRSSQSRSHTMAWAGPGSWRWWIQEPQETDSQWDFF
jgi:hypothetical protein